MKFLCTYAYDIACYSHTFTVEADTEAAANELLQKALANGRFDNVHCKPDWECSPTDERAFVICADREPYCTETLDTLTNLSPNP